jgi:hypothetical protein
MRVTPWLVGLLLLYAGSAQAVDVAISVVVEPSPLQLGYRDTRRSGHIVLSVPEGSTMPPLSLRVLPLRSGTAFALAGFPGNNGNDFIEVSESAQKIDIPIDITRLEVPGSYEGLVDVVVKKPGFTVTPTKIVAVRPDANFAPAIGGAAFKDGRIAITTSDSEPVSSFTVQVPQGSPKRDLEIKLDDALGKALRVTPKDRFPLAPGEQKIVILSPPPDLRLDTYSGVLTIRDADHPDLFSEVFVSVTKVKSMTGRTITLFAFVFVGALVSVLLNNIFPVSLAKRRTRQSLTNAESTIRGCDNVSSTLQAVLLAETAHVRLLNGAFGWYTTTKSEQMQQVDTLLKTLQACVVVANEISKLRTTIGQNSRIPVRLSQSLEEKLLSAENYLVDRRHDLAKAAVDEATNLLGGALSTANLTVLRADLATEIDELLALPAPATPRVGEIQAILTDLTTDLKAGRAVIDTASVDRLLELERSLYISRTYIRDVERNAAANPNLEAFSGELLSRLIRETTSTTTRLLVALAQKKLAPKDVTDAIAAREARIASANKVLPYQIVDFRFVFDDLQEVEAARRLCSYEWDFADNALTPPSDFCRHFFDWTQHRGLIRRRLDWVSQKFARLSSGPRKRNERTVKVSVTPPLRRGDASEFATTIDLLPKRDRGFGAIGIEVSMFFISFFIAICAAYGTQYATLPTADSLSVFITAFLFGFGLDQIRDRTTTH